MTCTYGPARRRSPACCCAQPRPRSPRKRSASISSSSHLPNGLTVILHRDATTPTLATNIWYRVGSAGEMPGRTGFAHLFEHIMFDGSRNVPEGAIDEWFEEVGGSPNR